MQDLRIIFMGTPEFAVASLDALVKSNYNVCAVVSAPDRPAGRGRKMKASAVKEYALQHGLRVLQPENLKDAGFQDELRALKAKLFIVVAFRMLPEAVWSMPELGTFNLHASLLPQYRGAAPINHAIINGEQKGGVSTFFLRHEIDTGNIIFREETRIGPDETAGEYHDRLMMMGAMLTIKTVRAIEEDRVHIVSQEELISKGEKLKTAPKIYKEDCRIDWNKNAAEVHNLIRGLSPYPGAFTELNTSTDNLLLLKIYRAEIKHCDCTSSPGTIMTDYKNYFNICCKDACISIHELQQAGKKRLKIKEFLAGLIPNTLG
ncbi:MAG: methionyl-tRNA formyltransferase [Bacteroidota bacterium]